MRHLASAERTWHHTAVPNGIVVVYEDAHVLVLDKPAGLLSVPGRGPDNSDCLSSRVQEQFPDALVVHRLDMGTSGLMLMARGVEVQRSLSIAFAQRQVHKTYQAVVAGVPQARDADDTGWSDIRLPLIVDWPNRPRSKVDFKDGKPSHTRWCPILRENLSSGEACTRLDLEPVTGRSHQLRVHLQALGHPILGDELYADGWVLQAAPRLLLHARAIGLSHPVTGTSISLQSPVPF